MMPSNVSAQCWTLDCLLARPIIGMFPSAGWVLEEGQELELAVILNLLCIPEASVSA